MALALAGPLVLAYLACLARRNLQVWVLQRAMPPQLRLVVDLRQRAETFRDWTRQLEEAMEQTTLLSEELHEAIAQERERLQRVHAEVERKAQLAALTPEQAEAVAVLLGRQQARSSRRALWSNIAVGLFFYLAGVITPALFSTEYAPRTARALDSARLTARRWGLFQDKH